MLANVSLHTKTQCWVRLVPEPDDVKITVKDRMDLSQLKARSRRKIEQCRNIWCYQYARAKSE